MVTATENATDSDNSTPPLEPAPGAETAAPAPPPEDRRREITRHLECKLTRAEQEDLRRQLLDVLDEEEAVTDRKKEAASRFKAEQESLRTRRHELARTMRRGAVERDVTCEVREHFATNKVETVRLDTGEVIEVRPMTAHERQIAMDWREPAALDTESTAADPAPPSEDGKPPLRSIEGGKKKGKKSKANGRGAPDGDREADRGRR